MNDNMVRGQIVRGEIVRFIRDRGFGFMQIEGSRQEVFFHMSGCVSVDGDFNQPVLTDERLPECTPMERPRSPQYVVAIVASGDRGPRAVKWGYLPRQPWWERDNIAGLLPDYVGGEISIMRDTSSCGREQFLNREEGRLINASVEGGKLHLKWQKRCIKMGHEVIYREDDGMGDEFFSLEFSGRKNSHYGFFMEFFSHQAKNGQFQKVHISLQRKMEV